LAEFYQQRYDYNKFHVRVDTHIALVDSNLISYMRGEDLKQRMRLMTRQFFDNSDLSINPAGFGDILGTNEGIGFKTMRIRKSDIFAQEDREKALDFNERIIALYPDNRDALHRKGILYYDENDFETFIGLFEEVITRNEYDKDAHLFLGLGYARTGDYEKSHNHYATAVSLMEPEERKIFESIDFISGDFERDRWNETKVIQNVDTTGFWGRKDPLFMTEFNERRQEHYGRIAEANLKFSVPSKNIAGWQTDRGRIWIRYGKPMRRMTYLMPEFDYHGVTGAKYPFEHTWQNWYYKDYTFIFTDMMNSLTGDLELSVAGGINFDEIEVEVAEKHPDSYEYKPRGRLIDLPVDIVRFRGSNDDTDVNLYFGAHLRDIGMTPAEGMLKGTLQQGMFLFDEDWNRLTSRIDTVGLEYDPADYDTSAAGFTTMTRSFSLPGGRYNLAVEVVDPVSGNTGTFRDSLPIEPFGYGSLQMSDVLIANEIQLLETGQSPSRANISVLGNPFHAFQKEQPVHLYFEIYNLLLSAANDRSSYRIEYALYPAREQGLLARVFRRREGGEWVSVASDITGTGRNDNRILAVEHSITEPGDYLLTLRITDKTSGQTAERTTRVRIY
ncbi:GWxTD domain-containing protein, partial [candidate division KSB1 bacterium]